MEDTKLKSSSTKTADTKKMYHLRMKFNGKEHQIQSDNLGNAIFSLKPQFLKTNITMSCIRSDGARCDKFIPVKTAKMFWANKRYMDMFINHIIFKYV